MNGLLLGQDFLAFPSAFGYIHLRSDAGVSLYGCSKICNGLVALFAAVGGVLDFGACAVQILPVFSKRVPDAVVGVGALERDHRHGGGGG